MGEETQLPPGLWQLSASKDQVPAAEKDQTPQLEVAGSSFLSNFPFLGEQDHCTGISSIGVAAVIIAASFEGACTYKTAGYESR